MESLRYRDHERQFCFSRGGSQVGPMRLRQHLQIPAISANSELDGMRHRRGGRFDSY